MDWRALAAALAISLTGAMLVGIVLPPLVALESLSNGEPHSIETGHEDWFFIADFGLGCW